VQTAINLRDNLLRCPANVHDNGIKRLFQSGKLAIEKTRRHKVALARSHAGADQFLGTFEIDKFQFRFGIACTK
jgi:hypothetical protein